MKNPLPNKGILSAAAEAIAMCAGFAVLLAIPLMIFKWADHLLAMGHVSYAWHWVLEGVAWLILVSVVSTICFTVYDWAMDRFDGYCRRFAEGDGSVVRSEKVQQLSDATVSAVERAGYRLKHEGSLKPSAVTAMRAFNAAT